jgi:peptidoglycan/xylan/chitin deacetylase (PgdA/CDA1 family)
MNRGEIYKLITAPGRMLMNMFDVPAVVLLYHRVYNLDFDPLELSVSPVHFNSQLLHLKNNFHVLNAEEFFYHVDSKKKFPPRSVFITFDDGYEDNFTEAMPILENNQLQAMFYITTSNLGSNIENWWDDLERMIYNSSFSGALKVKTGKEIIETTLTDKASREQAYSKFHFSLKKLPFKDRDAVLIQLHEQSGINEEGRLTHRMMSWDQLKKFSMSRAVAIGAHTHSHCSLSAFVYEDQLHDILTSKNILEESLQKKVEHFSYPFGTRKDFNYDTMKACKAAGFTSTFANVYGQVRSNSSLYNMPRMLVRDWPLDIFKNKMEGFFRY